MAAEAVARELEVIGRDELVWVPGPDCLRCFWQAVGCTSSFLLRDAVCAEAKEASVAEVGTFASRALARSVDADDSVRPTTRLMALRRLALAAALELGVRSRA